ncbi:MAG: glycosyltransferase [bacterium]
MKVALVHDFLVPLGGAEKVFQTICQTYTDAPIFTLVYDPKKIQGMFSSYRIQTSFLQHLPLSKSHYQWYLPLMPLATESYNLDEFDVVISSSSAFAKAVITKPHTLHFCYCHSPTRYLWSDAHSYLNRAPIPAFTKILAAPLLSKLRAFDALSANRVDYFIANSKTVAARIQKYYRRNSIVIYPPVRTQYFSVSPKVEDYFLTGGRLVAYKRYDLTIKAFNKLGLKLKIFGDGPELFALKRLAHPNIEFLGVVTPLAQAELYQKALAFIHPQLEDFGLTPVEAMASGRPVIAFRAGGATESVIQGQTGIFFDEQTPEALIAALTSFKPKNFNPTLIREHSLNFSEENFVKNLRLFVKEKWDSRQQY